MPLPPQPRFTDLETLGYYLSVSGASVPSQTMLATVLSSAETLVERYCRRHFAPEPALRADYKRQVITVAGTGQQAPASLAGSLALAYGADETGPLPLPLTAAEVATALTALPSVGAGKLHCAGGPLPQYPINVYLTGLGADPGPISVDYSALLPGGYAVVTDKGFDSNPPVLKRFTTRGQSTIRVPDLRAVEAEPDPRAPDSGGIQLYGRRLLTGQFSLGYSAYAGGDSEPFGEGSYAEPSTELSLGYGYGYGPGSGSLAEQFGYMLPVAYQPNDLSITGRWGFNPVPPDLIDATYQVASRRYREREAAFADTLVSPEGVAFSFFKQLPAAVQAVLDGYRVPNVALV